MAETEAEVIEVLLDVQETQSALENLTKGLDALQTLAVDIGREMAKAFAPLQKILQKVEHSIVGMTDALTDAGAAMQELITELDASQLLDTIGTVVDSLALVTEVALNIGDVISIVKKFGSVLVSVIGVIGTALSSIGTWVAGTLVPAISGAFAAIGSAISAAAAALGISVGALVAVIVAVVAAITAAVIVIVKNWDKISSAFAIFFTETLPQLWAQFVQWGSGVVTFVMEACRNLWSAIVSVLTPLAEWFGTLWGSIRQTIEDSCYNIGVIVVGCWQLLQAVWGVVAEWFRGNVIEPVETFFSALWADVCTLATGAWEGIKSVFITVAQWFGQYVVQPVADFFTGLWEEVKNAAVQAWEGIKSVFSKVTDFFKDVFSEAWAGVVSVFSIAGEIFTDIKDGILTAFKKIVNGIISGINSVVRIPFNGINSALSTLRGISILGISPFTGLRSISVPQIPYLAQGAVLPANKPFLAVVGDQRHGTNVEAPLATIQEAVGLVLENQISAMMAGFQALLEEQRATRMAVESIRVGDDTIAAAVDRHRVRMAMMLGY